MIKPARLNRFYVETEIVPVTRLWEAEIPVGDPFGGAAYGEKNKKFVKSVVKVVKKVAPIALGVAATFATGGAFLGAYGALAAGGSLAAAVTSGIAFAGASLSLVGNVTGNEKLSKIGSVLGLAGGVGMVGTNIAAAAQGGAGFSESVVKGLQDTANQLKQGAQESWGKLTGSPVGGAMGGAEAQLVNTPTPGEAMIPTSDLANTAPGVSSEVASAASGAGQAATQPSGLIAGSMGGNVSPGLDGVAGDLGANYASANKGLISQIMQGAKDVGKFVANKENAGLVTLGGNILTNIVPSEKDEAEKALYEARARQIEDELAERERFNSSIQRQSNMRVNPNARVFNPGSAYVPGQTQAYQRALNK